jgi:hypothetical protein
MWRLKSFALSFYDVFFDFVKKDVAHVVLISSICVTETDSSHAPGNAAGFFRSCFAKSLAG